MEDKNGNLHSEKMDASSRKVVGKRNSQKQNKFMTAITTT